MSDYSAGATYAPEPPQAAGEGTAEQIKEQARQTTQAARQTARSATARPCGCKPAVRIPDDDGDG